MVNSSNSKKYIPKISLPYLSFLKTIERLSGVEKLAGPKKISSFYFGLSKMVILSSIETIQQAGKLEKQGKLDRQQFNADYLPILGNGAFTVPQSEWEDNKRRIMRYLTPTGGNEAIWSAIALRVSKRSINQWKQESSVDAKIFCRTIAQEMIIEVFFGSPDALNKRKLQILIKIMFLSAETISFLRLVLTDYSTGLIKPLQYIGQLAGNSLTRMIESATPLSNSPATDPEFRKELRTLLFAGQDSLTSALINCLWILGNNLELQQSVRDDIHTHGKESNLLQQVISETFRILPPVHTPPARVCPKALEINGEQIPADSVVLYGLWHAHHRCSQPDQFKPERFQNLKSARKLIAPFGVGPKRCVGENLARCFLTNVLAEIIKQGTVKSLSDTTILKPRTILIHKKPINISFSQQK